MIALTWVVGVVLAALAAFISNLGYNLQKYQHNIARENSQTVRARSWQLYWYLGVALVVFGSVGDLAALSISPQSLIAPLGSLTLVSNVIVAPLLLKERVQLWPDIAATLIIVVGSSVAVAFADHSNSIYPAQRLFGFYHQPHFAIYAALTSTYILAGYLFIVHMQRVEREERRELVGGNAGGRVRGRGRRPEQQRQFIQHRLARLELAQRHQRATAELGNVTNLNRRLRLVLGGCFAVFELVRHRCHQSRPSEKPKETENI